MSTEVGMESSWQLQNPTQIIELPLLYCPPLTRLLSATGRNSSLFPQWEEATLTISAQVAPILAENQDLGR